ncbi:trypsin-like peptidase domain-containing protein [Bradyrhizobium sp. DASA03076]|uniref:trypsin-like peptidase domain-containing protein n=1 Tax=Bradyrhizobium sp. BLXBL-03 TaxID=3395916 RepID=UPI003F707F2F
MTSFKWFDDQVVHEIAQLVVTIVGYDPPRRNALLTGVMPLFAQALPGVNVPPLFAATLDLGVLNSVRRLSDGSVPMKIWLRNAVTFSVGREDAEPLRQKLDQIELRSTGAPKVDPGDLRELKEVVVHHDDMVPYEYMKAGLVAANAIAKLSVPRYSNKNLEKNDKGEPVIYLGTAWLVAPNLLLTNHHVINARDDDENDADEADLVCQAETSKAQFDFNSDGMKGVTIGLKELVAWDAKLDYALLRTEPIDREPLQIGEKLAQTNNTRGNIALNIIQHPDGQPKKFAIRNNLLTGATDTDLRYFTDTLGGSSGSPVFNDRWQVVGLHRGATRVSDVNYNGRSVAYVNVGTQLSAIKGDLLQRYSGKVPELRI